MAQSTIAAELNDLVAIAKDYAQHATEDAKVQFQAALSALSARLRQEDVSLQSVELEPGLTALAAVIQQHEHVFEDTDIAGCIELDSLRPQITIAGLPDVVPGRQPTSDIRKSSVASRHENVGGMEELPVSITSH